MTQLCEVPLPTVLLLPQEWPDADDEGVTHLPAEIAVKLFATLTSIANFVEAYRDRCTETGD